MRLWRGTIRRQPITTGHTYEVRARRPFANGSELPVLEYLQVGLYQIPYEIFYNDNCRMIYRKSTLSPEPGMSRGGSGIVGWIYRTRASLNFPAPVPSIRVVQPQLTRTTSL